MAPSRGVQIFRQTPANLVKDQAHQWFGPADVGGWHDEVKSGRPVAFDEITDAPVAVVRNLRYHRVTVEPQERHGSRKHAGAFILAFAEKLARRRRDDRMRPRFAKMR